MSEATQTVRVRPLRPQSTAAAAVERARLSLVPNRPSSAPRAPFAVLVFLILGAGVVGLLMFNTQMQQASFHATELQAEADRLEARSEALARELKTLTDPQNLGKAGRRLGMVEPRVPAFVDLESGKVLGKPTAAEPEDRLPINDLRKSMPGWANPDPIERQVTAPPAPETPETPGAQTPQANGPASAGNGQQAGRNTP